MTIKKVLRKWQLDVFTIVAIATLLFFAGTPTGIAMAQSFHDTNILGFYAIFVPLAGFAFTWGYKRIKERIK